MLDSFREELGGGRTGSGLIRAVRVLQGDPSQVILDQAQKLSVDLLILGSHSHGAGAEARRWVGPRRASLQLSRVPGLSGAAGGAPSPGGSLEHQ